MGVKHGRSSSGSLSCTHEYMNPEMGMYHFHIIPNNTSIQQRYEEEEEENKRGWRVVPHGLMHPEVPRSTRYKGQMFANSKRAVSPIAALVFGFLGFLLVVLCTQKIQYIHTLCDGDGGGDSILLLVAYKKK